MKYFTCFVTSVSLQMCALSRQTLKQPMGWCLLLVTQVYRQYWSYLYRAHYKGLYLRVMLPLATAVSFYVLLQFVTHSTQPATRWCMVWATDSVVK